ncbi:MAG: xanthine dehydrogenase family protein subunit M, partial [bacterium]|nr:xanthine dehydrogenase family protein subunit M [bacterium]
AAPKTLGEALALLAEDGAKALAGGMSLSPLMKLRLAAPAKVVDLSRIPELKGIRMNSEALHIGALTTHADVEGSALVRSECPLLAETAGQIGDLQVRNAGTLGGSVAHNDPAADYPATLFALGARAKVASIGNPRTVPLNELLVDTMMTSLEPGELITEIIVPVEETNTGTSYQKMKQPASGFAIVGVAARVRKSNGVIDWARVGVTGLSGAGFRATAAEERLAGAAGSAEDIQNAAATVADGVDANSDIHASADYRKHVATVYAARAIQAALQRTG